MRGKETAYNGNAIVGRITPAYAGKSGIMGFAGVSAQDHPRLCGEKLFWSNTSLQKVGSPPPMRGKD